VSIGGVNIPGDSVSHSMCMDTSFGLPKLRNARKHVTNIKIKNPCQEGRGKDISFYTQFATYYTRFYVYDNSTFTKS
jgi:hypothetical protein